MASVGSTPVFHPTPAPRDEDIAHVAAAVCRRVERKLSTRKVPTAQRRFEESAQVWCALAGASAGGVVATGPRRGRYLLRVRGARADVNAFVTGRLCAEVAGPTKTSRVTSYTRILWRNASRRWYC